MRRFEYHTVIVEPKGIFFGGKVNPDNLTQILNNMGNQGWELVSTVASNKMYGVTENVVCIFKREIGW
jgi:hypothetical protein